MSSLALMLETSWSVRPSGRTAAWVADPPAQTGAPRETPRRDEAELIARVQQGDEAAANAC